MNDGNAGKKGRQSTQDVMENGEQLQMFVVSTLPLNRRGCFHGGEINKIWSNGLVQIQQG
jgi:hypothetical protein